MHVHTQTHIYIHAVYDRMFSTPQVWEEPLSPMSSWTTQQVCHWLKGLNMEQYVPEFSGNDVDGQQLLQLDGKALKVRTPQTGVQL